MSSSDKKDIRLTMEKWRAELAAEDVEAASRAICGQLYELIPWDTISNVHCYLPLRKHNEVNTAEVLENIWQNYPHVVTSVPIIRSKTMLACTVTPNTQWQTGALGMPEPVEISMSTAQQFDVVIVPMLAFNEQGYRIGYGKGYYDKFLAGQPEALTVGLCYERGLAAFQAEAHDVPLKVIVTESQIREFR